MGVAAVGSVSLTGTRSCRILHGCPKTFSPEAGGVPCAWECVGKMPSIRMQISPTASERRLCMTVPFLRLAVAMFVVRTPSLIVVDGVADRQIAAADVAATKTSYHPNSKTRTSDEGETIFPLPLL